MVATIQVSKDGKYRAIRVDGTLYFDKWIEEHGLWLSVTHVPYSTLVELRS